jgi:phosphonate transport system substrate-binding protein
VLAHEMADAEAVSTYAGADNKPGSYYATITTWPGSGITKLSDVRGKAFAFADPASTSGHLVPSYALRKAGVDPDKDIRPFYFTPARTPPASRRCAITRFRWRAQQHGDRRREARGHVGSRQLRNPVAVHPIPNGPIALRGDLDPTFKARLTKVLQTMDISTMPPEDMKFLGRATSRRFAAIDDYAYDGIRDIVSVLHIDLAKIT